MPTPSLSTIRDCVPNNRAMQAVREHQDSVKSSSHPPLGKTLGVKGTLNRTLLQVQQHRHQLGSFEQFQGEHFEDLMRQHAANPKAMSMELHMQRFADVRGLTFASRALTATL